MNTRFIFRLLAVAVLVIPGVRVLAQNVSGSEYINYRALTLDQMVRNMREASEREELRASRKPAAPQPSALSAANFDLNKDGKLDDAEFTAWTGAVRQAVTQAPDAMKRFDANKDGKLDDAEWSAALDRLFGAR